ncbi:phosphotransferase [Mycobacterium deserti]|uniref:Phosphotransferase n=1 Tax=Mycobacterium deserti TaxID=2978347 RepID=A0ABT2M4I9_9MYCO|nr:phosphotransferase [Mycobacterium deserti]MCT7657186.1 phosphotransferase [Mycobacterium deserti]
MAPHDDGRHTDAALAWAAETIGGRIIRQERQKRWRPTFYLDIERPDGTVKHVMLRGFRAPIGPAEESFRERLRMEAGICRALGEAGCKVPGFHGYEPNGGWFLMDTLPGTPFLTGVDDPDRQASLFRQYVEAVVAMQKLDYRTLDLPDNLPMATTYEEGVNQMLDEFRQPYDFWPDKGPEPLIELTLWWLENHPPKPVDNFSLTTGDIGTDQFMFEGDTMTGMFDLEMAYVGDPMQDIGLMRLRDLCYPLPGLPDHLHYWAELMGRELDKQSLCYWTVAGMMASPLYVYPLWHQPIPQIHRDGTQVHAFIPIHFRGTCEALAEFYGFELDPSARPEPHVNTHTRYNTWLVGQMRDYFPDGVDDDNLLFDYECGAAVAEAAVLGQTLGPMLEQQTIEDFERLMNRSFASELEGLDALQSRIRQDPEKDLEQTIRVLHRFHSRAEFITEPIQTFAGFRSGLPLQRVF